MVGERLRFIAHSIHKRYHMSGGATKQCAYKYSAYIYKHVGQLKTETDYQMIAFGFM